MRLAGVDLAARRRPSFALPLTTTAGTAPWWAGADASASSLQITAVTAATAHLVAVHDPAVAAHPWLARATDYCLRAIGELDRQPHAYVLSFALRFLDAVHDSRPEAVELLAHLRGYVPADGRLRVEGGTADEMLRPLDFAPWPDRPIRELFAPDVVAADLDRLAGLQHDDGGWSVDYATISPAGALDWRGYTTVHAITVLRRNDRI